jgi:hypothetical protein
MTTVDDTAIVHNDAQLDKLVTSYRQHASEWGELYAVTVLRVALAEAPSDKVADGMTAAVRRVAQMEPAVDSDGEQVWMDAEGIVRWTLPGQLVPESWRRLYVREGS